jgi:uncharacterized protein (TIGR02246 family)
MTEEMKLRNSKRIRIAVLGAVATALVAAGCGTSANASAPSSTPSTDQAAITDGQVQDLFDEWNDALTTLDANEVADRYAPDAVLVPTLSNQVRPDRAGIVDYFEHFLEDKPQGTILESHVKLLNPNAAIDTGTYRFSFNGGERTVDARYTFVYERVDGEWLIVNHHSSGMPETQPAG